MIDRRPYTKIYGKNRTYEDHRDHASEVDPSEDDPNLRDIMAFLGISNIWINT